MMKIPEMFLCTNAQGFELKQLGITQHKSMFSHFWWSDINPEIYGNGVSYNSGLENIATEHIADMYTAEELSVMLPAGIDTHKSEDGTYGFFIGGKCLKYFPDNCGFQHKGYATEAIARADALIWLISKGMLSAEDINKVLDALDTPTTG